MERKTTVERDSHLRFGIRVVGIVLAFLLLRGGIAGAQTPPRPLFLKSLVLNFDRRVNFPARRFRQQYQNRPYTPALLKEIRGKIAAQLEAEGYYFSRIAAEKTEIDSAEAAVYASLDVATGAPLQLDSVYVENPDSLPPALAGEVDEALAAVRGRTYTAALSQSLFRDVLSIFENNGYPLARLRTGNFAFRPGGDQENWALQLGLHLRPGDSVRVAYLRFPGQQNNLRPHLQRLLRFQAGEPFDAQRIEKYLRVLRRQEYLKNVQEPELALDREGNYFLNIRLEETPGTAFDGIIGYIPPPANDPSASGYFTGLINVGIRNLFGGGRKLQVFWQKQDRFSDEFRLAYREPFVAGLPFHAGVGMQRLVRDTTFIEWQYRLGVELPLSETLSAFADVSSRNVSPDSLASRQLRLPRTASVITETGIRWDVRDDLYNPRRGVALEMAFGLSRQENQGPAYLVAEDSLLPSVTLRKVRIEFSVFLPTFQRQVLSNHFHANLIESRGEVLRLTDQVWFGGATSVRGFREAQFFGRRVFWLNSEYRFLLGPQARFFVFSDNAYFERQSPESLKKWLSSYGLGLRLNAPLGIMQIDFGLERGAPFQEGKLHIRLINEF